MDPVKKQDNGMHVSNNIETKPTHRKQTVHRVPPSKGNQKTEKTAEKVAADVGTKVGRPALGQSKEHLQLRVAFLVTEIGKHEKQIEHSYTKLNGELGRYNQMSDDNVKTGINLAKTQLKDENITRTQYLEFIGKYLDQMPKTVKILYKGCLQLEVQLSNEKKELEAINKQLYPSIGKTPSSHLDTEATQKIGNLRKNIFPEAQNTSQLVSIGTLQSKQAFLQKEIQGLREKILQKYLQLDNGIKQIRHDEKRFAEYIKNGLEYFKEVLKNIKDIDYNKNKEKYIEFINRNIDQLPKHIHALYKGWKETSNNLSNKELALNEVNQQIKNMSR